MQNRSSIKGRIKVIMLFAILFNQCKFYSIHNKAINRTRSVSGQIVQTNTYCGGMAPTKEALERARKEKPFSKHLLVSTNKNSAEKAFIVADFLSDSLGKFSLQLKPNTYYIFDSEKQDTVFNRKTFTQHILTSKTCYDNWRRTPDVSFTVKDKDLDTLKIIFHLPCFTESVNPCLRYTGVLPQ